LLGDYTGWSDTAIDSYQKALELWRNEGRTRSLVALACLRKLLVNYTRGAHSKHPSPEEVKQLKTEAQQLAEICRRRR